MISTLCFAAAALVVSGKMHLEETLDKTAQMRFFLQKKDHKDDDDDRIGDIGSCGPYDGAGWTCFEQDGKERCFFTYVPETYNSAHAAAVTMYLHGFTGCADPQKTSVFCSGWAGLAEDNGSILILPQAYEANFPGNWGEYVSSWNSDVACTEDTPNDQCRADLFPSKEDDVSFLLKVLQKTREAYNVDSSRMYISGHSNGCAMAQRLIAEVPNVFAAASCTSAPVQESVAPASDYPGTSLRLIHAVNDFVVQYNPPAPPAEIQALVDSYIAVNPAYGTENYKFGYDRATLLSLAVPEFPGAADTLETWKNWNGCSDSSTTSNDPEGLYTTTTYSECAPGVKLELVTLLPASQNTGAPFFGHSPFVTCGGSTVDAPTLAWDFMKDFTCATCTVPNLCPRYEGKNRCEHEGCRWSRGTCY